MFVLFVQANVPSVDYTIV